MLVSLPGMASAFTSTQMVSHNCGAETVLFSSVMYIILGRIMQAILYVPGTGNQKFVQEDSTADLLILDLTAVIAMHRTLCGGGSILCTVCMCAHAFGITVESMCSKAIIIHWYRLLACT